MGWRMAHNQAEAGELTRALKSACVFDSDWGEVDADGLVVHESAQGRIDGAFYFVPSYLYTMLAEVWLAAPWLCTNYREPIRIFFEAHPDAHRKVIGIISADRQRYIAALLKQGAAWGKVAVQLNFDGRDS